MSADDDARRRLALGEIRDGDRAVLRLLLDAATDPEDGGGEAVAAAARAVVASLAEPDSRARDVRDAQARRRAQVEQRRVDEPAAVEASPNVTRLRPQRSQGETPGPA